MKKFLLPALALLLVISCHLFDSTALEVSTWSPEESELIETSSIEIKVSFSKEPDRTSVEEAFFLTSDGVEIPGNFNWKDGKTLEYIVFHPLSPGHDYCLKVSTQAEDIQGNSLKTDFIHLFTTKRSKNRPKLINQEPDDFDTISNNYQEIVFTFDKEMDPASVVSQFSIAPFVKGYFTWDVNQEIFTFNPADCYSWQEDYIVTLTGEVSDIDGWSLGYEHLSQFHVGVDQTPPLVLFLSDEAGSNVINMENPDDSTINITQSWEKNWNIIIQFSEYMNHKSVEGALTIEPQCHWTNEWSVTPQGDLLLLKWDESLDYDTNYSLRISDSGKDLYDNSFIDDQNYHFRTNGGSSKPPEIIKLVYIKEPGSSVLREEILFNKDDPDENNVEFLFSNIDESGSVPVYFDFYFDLAEDAFINQFSFMENFSIIAQDGAVTFTPTNIIAKIDEDNPDYGSIPPDLSDNYQVVRVIGEMEDNSLAVGRIDFKVYREFEDTLGNSFREDWHWEVFDIDI